MCRRPFRYVWKTNISLWISTDAARAMLEAGNCTFYTPESLGDVKLELFAVLRS